MRMDASVRAVVFALLILAEEVYCSDEITYNDKQYLFSGSSNEIVLLPSHDAKYVYAGVGSLLQVFSSVNATITKVGSVDLPPDSEFRDLASLGEGVVCTVSARSRMSSFSIVSMYDMRDQTQPKLLAATNSSRTLSRVVGSRFGGCIAGGLTSNLVTMDATGSTTEFAISGFARALVVADNELYVGCAAGLYVIDLLGGFPAREYAVPGSGSYYEMVVYEGTFVGASARDVQSCVLQDIGLAGCRSVQYPTSTSSATVGAVAVARIGDGAARIIAAYGSVFVAVPLGELWNTVSQPVGNAKAIESVAITGTHLWGATSDGYVFLYEVSVSGGGATPEPADIVSPAPSGPSQLSLASVTVLNPLPSPHGCIAVASVGGAQYAFVGFGHRLFTVALPSGGAPSTVANISLEAPEVMDLAANGSTLYLASGQKVWRMDTTNPTDVRPAGSFAYWKSVTTSIALGGGVWWASDTDNNLAFVREGSPLKHVVTGTGTAGVGKIVSVGDLRIIGVGNELFVYRAGIVVELVYWKRVPQVYKTILDMHVYGRELFIASSTGLTVCTLRQFAITDCEAEWISSGLTRVVVAEPTGGGHTFAYCTSASAMHTVDVTTRTSMSVVSKTAGTFISLAIANDYVYALNSDGSLYAYKMSLQPVPPPQVSFAPPTYSPWGAAFLLSVQTITSWTGASTASLGQGSRMYVTGGADLWVYDLTDVMHPKEVGTFTLEQDAATHPATIYSIAEIGPNRLCVANGFSVRVLDTTVLSDISQLFSAPNLYSVPLLSVTYGGANLCLGVASSVVTLDVETRGRVWGDILHNETKRVVARVGDTVVMGVARTLYVVRVVDGAPLETSDLVQNHDVPWDVEALQTYEGRLFVSGRVGLTICELRSAGHPLLGRCDSFGDNEGDQWVSVAVATVKAGRRIAFVANTRLQEIIVIEVTNPAAMHIVRRGIHSQYYEPFVKLAVTGEHLYAITSTGQLYIYDIEYMSAPPPWPFVYTNSPTTPQPPITHPPGWVAPTYVPGQAPTPAPRTSVPTTLSPGSTLSPPGGAAPVLASDGGSGVSAAFIVVGALGGVLVTLGVVFVMRQREQGRPAQPSFNGDVSCSGAGVRGVEEMAKPRSQSLCSAASDAATFALLVAAPVSHAGHHSCQEENG